MHYCSDTSLSEGEIIPNTGIKKKHPEEEEDDEDEEDDAGKPEIKRVKFDNKEEEETECEETESSCCKEAESSSETSESSRDSCDQEYKSDASCGTPHISEDHGRG